MSERSSLLSLDDLLLFSILDQLTFKEIEKLGVTNTELYARIYPGYFEYNRMKPFENDQGNFDMSSVEKVIEKQSQYAFDFLYYNHPEVIREYYSPRNNFRILRKRYPHIFGLGYSRGCERPRQPRIYTPVEKTYWDNQEVRSPVGFPKTNPQIYLVAPDPRFPYVGLKRNIGENQETYPLLPCSYMNSRNALE